MATKPTHYVYTVKEGKEKDSSFWTKIGVVFSHNDGQGFNVMLDAVPLNGKLTIRAIDKQA
jgi:hypothetical protein